MEKMPVLTVKEPWASLIVHGIKTVENRTWGVPGTIIGKRIAIHCSIKIDASDNAAAIASEIFLAPLTAFALNAGRIIGTAVVIGEVCMPDGSETPGVCGCDPKVVANDDLKWWNGEAYFGWVLRGAKPFNVPRPLVRGHQGIWYWKPTIAICRECGCTDESACYDPANGEPCHWIEADLCSACGGLREAL